MDIGKVTAVLESPSEDTIRALLDDDSTVFWIDWRQEDDTIAECCESILRTGRLSSELIDVNTHEGYEVWLQFRDQREQVPLSYSVNDRHMTLCALNRLLAPEYEVRFIIDSKGSDTLAFLPLSCNEWADFERQYGEAVSRRFYRFSDRPNLFTEPLPC